MTTVYRARFEEIETQARMGIDALWHLSDAIRERSPDNAAHEARVVLAKLNRIIELSQEPLPQS